MALNRDQKNVYCAYAISNRTARSNYIANTPKPHIRDMIQVKLDIALDAYYLPIIEFDKAYSELVDNCKNEIEIF